MLIKDFKMLGDHKRHWQRLWGGDILGWLYEDGLIIRRPCKLLNLRYPVPATYLIYNNP